MPTMEEHASTFFTRGVNDSAAATAYRPGEAALIYNMVIDPEGNARVRDGTRKLHTATLNGGAPTYGMTKRPFKTAAGVKTLGRFCGDKFYSSIDGGATWVLVASGQPEKYWSMATMRVGADNFLLAVCDGAAIKFDGTTFSALANCPAGATQIAVANGRAMVCGEALGPYVNASKVFDPETWTGASAQRIPVQTHDGDESVNGLFQIGSQVLAFKRSSTNTINGSGQTDLVVLAGAKGESRTVGLLGLRTPQPAGDRGCMWLSDRGIEYYVPGRGIVLITENVRKFFQEIAWADIAANPYIPDALYVPSPGKHQYILTVPASGGRNDHNVRVHLSLPFGNSFAITFDPLAPSTGLTFYGDARGSLSVSAGTDRARVRSIAGSMTLTTGNEPGLYGVDLGSGRLGVAEVETSPTALFSQDLGGTDNSAPCAAGIDGWARQMDKGEKDNEEPNGTGGVAYTGILRDRPGLFGAPFAQKWGRVAQAYVSTPKPAVLTLAMLADGVEKSSKAISVAAGEGDTPPARLSARGTNLQLEARSTQAGLKLGRLSMLAQVMGRRV